MGSLFLAFEDDDWRYEKKDTNLKLAKGQRATFNFQVPDVEKVEVHVAIMEHKQKVILDARNSQRYSGAYDDTLTDDEPGKQGRYKRCVPGLEGVVARSDIYLTGKGRYKRCVPGLEGVVARSDIYLTGKGRYKRRVPGLEGVVARSDIYLTGKGRYKRRVPGLEGVVARSDIYLTGKGRYKRRVPGLEGVVARSDIYLTGKDDDWRYEKKDTNLKLAKGQAATFNFQVPDVEKVEVHVAIMEHKQKVGMSESTKNEEKGKPENEINIKKNM
ncbi:predicted protein [Nematostella vectensis]|uniref:Uncharacterized protein n=1 Tax=Nematostella vectensis TaxID=45351 RepID=A7SIH6_NEMVE|nr:predicted protein [Nematostella vectensis]|eukprot:XP_001628535.1 predicted protein [Nematostella vectensis]